MCLFIVKMNFGLSFVDITLWCAVVYLVTYIPCIEMRVDELDQPAPREQPPDPTVRPELIEQHLKLGKCFHMPRSMCPTKSVCTTLGPGNMSVFCCDMDSVFMKETLPGIILQNKTYLHVLNASIDELDISQSMFRRLASMAFTDGNIGKIIGQFPKHSAIACLNISNNNLTSAKPQPSMQRRPFAYLYNLTVLDASANNLTEFPPSLFHSNRRISVDLSGNNYLPCKQFEKAMEANNNSLIEFLNYNKTYCAVDLRYSWFKGVGIMQIDHVRVQKELNISCRNIQPANINCSCVPNRLEVLNGEMIYLASVDCSMRHLKQLPTNLPQNTVLLNVSYNNITSLKTIGDDPSYEHVSQLYVDHNDIQDIVELEGTKFIDTFMLFSITYNKLKMIQTYVLSNRIGITGPKFAIGGNVIHCDCTTEKMLKPWIFENYENIPDYKSLECQDGMGPVVDLLEHQVCHTPRDWTDYIYYIIFLEVLVLVLLISKVSYDYWVFKTSGYLPWPANKMPRLPCDWLCE